MRAAREALQLGLAVTLTGGALAAGGGVTLPGTHHGAPNSNAFAGLSSESGVQLSDRNRQVERLAGNMLQVIGTASPSERPNVVGPDGAYTRIARIPTANGGSLALSVQYNNAAPIPSLLATIDVTQFNRKHHITSEVTLRDNQGGGAWSAECMDDDVTMEEFNGRITGMGTTSAEINPAGAAVFLAGALQAVRAIAQDVSFAERQGVAAPVNGLINECV